ncbi:hypothetical protein D9757_003671 [Collybiopsis confluens]|uniref:carbonic anhydrase n=1 Tax=Collybiopsis confluens TaxID=2823264 RepID=A0A8H5HUT2_9AGAR|nr:hypothetical protein D9757_003671 [Collybiopsis confluens]
MAVAQMLSANAQWAKDVESYEPGFFARSAQGQSPHTLWIGCADSRVPESVITGAKPGDLFVNRNVGKKENAWWTSHFRSQVHLDDDNMLAVLTYAVEQLGVEHVVVCGHTECGAAAACFGACSSVVPGQTPITIGSYAPDAPLNRWLASLTTIAANLHLSSAPPKEALVTLVEENVRAQVNNLCLTDVIMNSWANGKSPKGKEVWVHGWVYDISQGRLRDLGVSRGPYSKGQLLVQIASYNTNLQGFEGVPQDLVDWLAPTLQVSEFLSHSRRGPDIVASLPRSLTVAGASKSVIERRSAHILSQIEAHSPQKEKYSLLAKIVNVGVALLVYARDDGVARKWMGNKGGVGVRFRVAEDGLVGETYTQDTSPTTMYSTSHLFFLGDLNFRVDLPKSHSMHNEAAEHVQEALRESSTRETLKEFDQLLMERRKRSAFVGLKEGEFWQFKCSYKYKLGTVDHYNSKRIPSWTDRILYTTYLDSPTDLETSHIRNLLYTSKPIVSLLLLPPRPPHDTADSDFSTTETIPTLTLPDFYTPKPDPRAILKRYTGRAVDRIVGVSWWLLTLLGAGSAAVGIFNFIIGVGAYRWWRSSSSELV